MEPNNYTNNSGGAMGADMTWDTIGRRYGVVNHRHWRPSDLINLRHNETRAMLNAVESAAKALGRPNHFNGVELVRRNWLQVANSEAVYAISRIIAPSSVDKGFINRSGKQVVSGGTGWAVEMAIQRSTPVWVYDMNAMEWYTWDATVNKFLECPIPRLTLTFAGIGSRQLTSKGIKAIEDVYIKTFNHGELDRA